MHEPLFASIELSAIPAALDPLSLPGVAVGDRWAEDADWALVKRVGRGDQAALATLYRKHHDRLCRFIIQITRDPHGVDDIVNETMLVVWQKAAVTTPQAQVSTWILGIGYRKALKAGERSRRTSREVPITDETEELPAEDDQRLARMESDEIARKALYTLSPEQRAVMELVYHDGLAYGDIARVLDCPENTVKTRMFHARRKLRALWPSLTGQPKRETVDEAS